MVDLYPRKCNLCGGDVIYTSNSRIYGREYGSGKCYYCTKCHAYVGTHKPEPRKALGLLANPEMRKWKKQCHALFDPMWSTASTSKKRHQQRNLAYKNLAKRLDIPVSECHFGYFDLEMLKKAYCELKDMNADVERENFEEEE